MITYIRINGFKSFHNFEMEFTPFTVIAGVNASGKSNLFDAFSLLSRLASTDLKTSFNEQRGNPSELFTSYGDEEYASEMEFVVEMLVNRNIKDNWGGDVELKYTRLRYELKIKRVKNELGIDDLVVDYEYLGTIKHKQDDWIVSKIKKPYLELWRPKVNKGRRGTPYIYTEYVKVNEDKEKIPRIIVPQDGTPGGNKKTFPAAYAQQTVLSSINSIDFPHVFAAKMEMQSWNFLQLNPNDLREPTRQEPGIQDTITSSGKNLAAALYRIYKNDEYNLTQISRKLNTFLPHFTDINVIDDKANRQFIISLKSEDGKLFSSRVLSEGTLRLLALCVLEFDDKHTGLICFEEPENGIHPFRLKAMAKLLKDLSANFSDPDTLLRQMIVNTHSPVLVSDLIQWQDDKNISVGLSHLKTTIFDNNNQRIKIKTTDIAFASPSDGQLSLPIEELSKRKLTMYEIKKYLETSDTQNALKALEL